MTAAAFVVGWVVGAMSLAFALGALMDYADRKMPPQQPAGVRDPETQLLWDESGRVGAREWWA